MGIFHVGARIESITDRTKDVSVPRLLVDPGSEYIWMPEPTLENLNVGREKKDFTFIMANRQKITRSVGLAIIRMEKNFTVDEVVFAEKNDLLMLGARMLEDLSLMVDLKRKKLFASGPLPVA